MDFEKIKEEFRNADITGKINIYVNTTGLTQDQYKELLQMYPVNEIGRLEAAL